MRAYLLVTGVIFGLIVVAHVWRMAAEAPRLASDPGFLALTVLSAVLCGWAIRLLLSGRRSSG
ncbi:hypothetical protein J421_5932 (plasmid) [Gemmatirosa kalamazoonensis]|uniref:Uncharacterized protein n=1 Tax=Gemmatirosa kalamazoonensis TaxID=861299 RepID=W0RSL8_9BACT|nr:hypothetical protein [Gemmatirosa kalamazoonensis]AHG93467.1 hypothetical protein J421_5932 [Gemmatirosa kalamazoonensis]